MSAKPLVGRMPPPAHRVSELVRTYRPLRDPTRHIHTTPTLTLGAPHLAAAALRPLIADQLVEVFGVACRSVRHHLLAWQVLSRGTRSGAPVSIPDVFVPAFLTAGTTGLVVVHNDPNGVPTPSGEDLALTQRLRLAAKLLDVTLLDHLIVGEDGRYYSFKEAGMLRLFATGSDATRRPPHHRPSRMAIVRRRSAPSSLGRGTDSVWGFGLEGNLGGASPGTYVMAGGDLLSTTGGVHARHPEYTAHRDRDRRRPAHLPRVHHQRAGQARRAIHDDALRVHPGRSRQLRASADDIPPMCTGGLARLVLVDATAEESQHARYAGEGHRLVSPDHVMVSTRTLQLWRWYGLRAPPPRGTPHRSRRLTPRRPDRRPSTRRDDYGKHRSHHRSHAAQRASGPSGEAGRRRSPLRRRRTGRPEADWLRRLDPARRHRAATSRSPRARSSSTASAAASRCCGPSPYPTRRTASGKSYCAPRRRWNSSRRRKRLVIDWVVCPVPVLRCLGACQQAKQWRNR